MVHRAKIRAAGEYLLSVLEKDRSAPYSRFANAEPGTRAALAEGVRPYLAALAERRPEEFTGGEQEDLLEEAHRYVGWAARQLEDIGVVQITPLAATLIEGERDFLIELTRRGEEFVADDEAFGYRRPDSRINAENASEWLIRFLQDGRYPRPTLYEAMRQGGLGADVAVHDDCGNLYGFETASFFWAFLVCLWHHVNDRVIRPAPESEKERAAWDDFFRTHQQSVGRPRMSEPQPVCDVPLRLTLRTLNHPDVIRHVGWMEE